MKKILLVAIPIILLIAVSLGAYRAYLQIKNLPANSIKTLREAISNGDAATFNSLFDADAVLEDAAKEILTAQINSEINSTTYSTQDVANLYQSRRQEFLASAKTALEEYVSGGKVNFPDSPTPTQKWLKDSEINSCAIKSFSKPVINEGKARTKVEFYNSSLRFSFELEVTLEKADNKNWRVVNVTGFENYLSGLNRALKKRLEEINAPIRDNIEDIFKLKGFSAKVLEGDEYGFSKTLRISMKAEVKSEKPLSKIIGRIIIEDRSGGEGVTPFTIDMAYHPQGLQTFNVDKVLNPFVRADADAMRHGLRHNEIHIEVTEIVYLDGTNLKQLDEIPN